MNLKPNLIFPAAASPNTRGFEGQHLFPPGPSFLPEDQIKRNCMYMQVRNSVTGTNTSYLVRRPGVDLYGVLLGDAGQLAYLVVNDPTSNSISSTPWLFNVSSNAIRVSSGTTTVTLSTVPSTHPMYVDRTSLNRVQTVYMQTGQVSTFNQQLWYASTAGTWASVSTGDFTSFSIRGKIETLNGRHYLLASDNGIYNTPLNTISTWSQANVITKNIQQDYPEGLARLDDLILAFGQETVEVFQDAGLNPAPLSRLTHLAANVGLLGASRNLFASGATHYYATLNERLYFIGREGGGFRSQSLFMFDGSRFEKVSPPYVDKYFISHNVKSVNTLSFHGNQAIAIGLNAPATSATQVWLMFFPRLNEWFEWISTVYTPVNSNMYFLGNNNSQHRIYAFFGNDKWYDDDTSYNMQFQFKFPQEGNERRQMDFFGVVADTHPTTTTSILNVAFTKDDWRTSTLIGTIDLTSQSKMITRCGSFQNLGVMLTHDGNTETRIEKIIARIR